MLQQWKPLLIVGSLIEVHSSPSKVIQYPWFTVSFQEVTRLTLKHVNALIWVGRRGLVVNQRWIRGVEGVEGGNLPLGFFQNAAFFPDAMT